MTDEAKRLKAFPAFSGLSDADLRDLAAHMDELDYPKGSKLIEQGKGNHTFYLLLDGAAEVEVDGEPRRTLKPGDFFGEISMQERRAATATVTAVTPVRAYVMSHQQFQALRGNPALADRVTAKLKERLAADQTT